MLVVKKFGGSSVANKERIFNVARRCIEDYKAGNRVVVVLSAMGDTTDDLIAKAHDINPDAPKREMDMLLSIGEQESVALMAMAMASMGVPAISLNAWQVGMHTTSTYSAARFKWIDKERLLHELDAGKIVIVTGFQGLNKYDDITTLGRGGSDTTAVAIRIVPEAKKLPEISYDEMLELATLGAQVLHNRSVEMAKKYGVTLVVRSSLNESEGTYVREVNNVEKMLVSGVACDKNAARIAAIGVKNEPGVAFRIFDLLAKNNINVDMILQSVGRDNTKDISFTVDQADAKDAIRVLKENQDRLTIQKFEDEENVAKLSIVGAGMQSNAGVAAKMFEALYDVNVNIRMISTSEIRITVLIDIDDVDRAMKAVHDKFIPEDD